MEPLNLLLVEDDEGVVKTYKSTINVYETKNNCKINLLESISVEGSIELIGRSIDAAIIDLKLGDDPDGGNKIIRNIHEKSYRFPITVLTGTPDETDTNLPLLSIKTKGDDFEEILDDIFSVYDTGITKIFGGRGLIEETMDKVFWDSVIPHLDIWKKYSSEGENIEKALIRFTISHLHHLIENDVNASLPEEMYIKGDTLGTGSIVKNKQSENFHIVVSPACDMVKHSKNSFKTTKVALCEIEKYDDVIPEYLGETNSTPKKIKAVERLIKNNHTNYYHWLPEAKLFSGGFINMRHMQTYEVTSEKNEISEEFDTPMCIISPHFMKDIISRFSGYYARQGQPDFSFKSIAENIVDSLD